MASVLERTRTIHEDIERAEQDITEILEKDAKSHRERLTHQHLIADRLAIIRDRQEELLAKYTDEDFSRKEEINSIAGEGPALFSAFYDRLKETKEYHRKFPDIVVSEEAFQNIDITSKFSGEESTGRYLDLHEHYDRFINLERTKSMTDTLHFKKTADHFDYTRYVSEFYLFDEEWSTKKGEYEEYLKGLLHYLHDFCCRIDPLEDIEGLSELAVKDFESLAKGFSWEEIRQNEKIAHSPSLVPAASSSADRGSSDDPLYCAPCKRRFAKETVYSAHLNGKKHLRAVELSSPKNAFDKKIGLLEFKIFRFGLFLQKVIERTIRNIEAKQAKNWEELQADFEEESEEEVSSEEEDDDDDIIQGIRDYPVGWDGKPIPFWLYKLHGLGVEYKCEICGNAAYNGRRNFERHFQEWRHTQGLKCLGISNTKHFSEITKIKDALSLQKKILADKKATQWNPEEQMEFEDSAGNVVSKKTFELMKKQGLL